VVPRCPGCAGTAKPHACSTHLAELAPRFPCRPPAAPPLPRPRCPPAPLPAPPRAQLCLHPPRQAARHERRTARQDKSAVIFSAVQTLIGQHPTSRPAAGRSAPSRPAQLQHPLPTFFFLTAAGAAASAPAAFFTSCGRGAKSRWDGQEGAGAGGCWRRWVLRFERVLWPPTPRKLASANRLPSTHQALALGADSGLFGTAGSGWLLLGRRCLLLHGGGAVGGGGRGGLCVGGCLGLGAGLLGGDGACHILLRLHRLQQQWGVAAIRWVQD
jgi:hypothetical protein